MIGLRVRGLFAWEVAVRFGKGPLMEIAEEFEGRRRG